MTITKNAMLLAKPPVITNMHGEGDEPNTIAHNAYLILEGQNLGSFDKELNGALKVHVIAEGMPGDIEISPDYFDSVTPTMIATHWGFSVMGDIGSTTTATIKFPDGTTIIANATVVETE